MGKILGCIGCGGCLGVCILIGIVGASFIGILPKLPGLFSFDSPRDLGITYTKEDSAASHKKAGNVEMIALPSDTPFRESFRLEGSKPVSFEMDSTEVSAGMSNRPWKYWPLDNVQVKISQDGSIEASAVVNAEKLLAYAEAIGFTTQDVKEAMKQNNIPFRNLAAYGKGRGSVTNNRASIQIDAITVGPIPIPGSIIKDNTGRVEDVVNTALSRIEKNNYIKSLTFENGKAKFEGSVPEKEYVVMR